MSILEVVKIYDREVILERLSFKELLKSNPNKHDEISSRLLLDFGGSFFQMSESDVRTLYGSGYMDKAAESTLSENKDNFYLAICDECISTMCDENIDIYYNYKSMVMLTPNMKEMDIIKHFIEKSGGPKKIYDMFENVQTNIVDFVTSEFDLSKIPYGKLLKIGITDRIRLFKEIVNKKVLN